MSTRRSRTESASPDRGNRGLAKRRFVRRGDRIRMPGFGLMDRDFTFYADRPSLLTIRWKADLMGGSAPRSQFTWNGRAWVHREAVDE